MGDNGHYDFYEQSYYNSYKYDLNTSNNTSILGYDDGAMISFLFLLTSAYFSCFLYRFCKHNREQEERLLIQEEVKNKQKSIIKNIKKKNKKYKGSLIGVQNKECSICLEDFKEGVSIIELKCNHIYHTACIIEWLTNNISCPLCRTSEMDLC